MKRLLHIMKQAPAALLIYSALFIAGCATTCTSEPEQLPPLLAQDELLRPYAKVATLEVRRTRWGHSEDLAPEDYSWAYLALRREAARIGADAVIIPEVRVRVENYYSYPVSEMNAKGIGIKFQ